MSRFLRKWCERRKWREWRKSPRIFVLALFATCALAVAPASMATAEDDASANYPEGYRDLSSCLVKKSSTVLTWNGASQYPFFSLWVDGLPLKQSVNYTAYYPADASQVGDYRILFYDMLGKCASHLTLKYTIVPKRVRLTTFSKKPRTRQLFAKWDRISYQIDSFQAQISSKSTFPSSKTISVKVNKSKHTMTFGKYKKKKTYYLRVRALKRASGRTIAGAWSNVKCVRT